MNIKCKKGFSLIEVLVAIVIFWMAIAMISPVLKIDSTTTISNIQKVRAYEIMNNEFEKIKFIKNYATELWKIQQNLYTTKYPWWESIWVTADSSSFNDLNWYYTIALSTEDYWNMYYWYFFTSGDNWLSNTYNTLKINEDTTQNSTSLSTLITPSTLPNWISSIGSCLTKSGSYINGCYSSKILIKNIWQQDSRNYPSDLYSYNDINWNIININPVKEITITVSYNIMGKTEIITGTYILTVLWNEKIY